MHNIIITVISTVVIIISGQRNLTNGRIACCALLRTEWCPSLHDAIVINWPLLLHAPHQRLTTFFNGSLPLLVGGRMGRSWRSPCNKWFLRPTWVSMLNSTSFSSAAFCRAHACDQQTDRQTDRQTTLFRL